MHGSAPLVRSIVNAATSSSSKIPHLRVHIKLRQTRSLQSNHNGANITVQQRRCQSTITHNSYLETVVDRTRSDENISSRAKQRYVMKETETFQDHVLSVENMNDALRETNMFNVLEEGFPDRILSALLSDEIGIPFIKQAEDRLFNRALLALDPDYFIEPFKELCRHIKGPRNVNMVQYKRFDERASTFAAYLDRIIAVRRETGKNLDLEACNHLLKCAGSMGDSQLARSVFENIMLEDGVVADLESHNYYCQALVWSHAFSSTENYNLRVLPKTLELRAAYRPPISLSGHTTSKQFRKQANTQTTVGAIGQGIREQVLEDFKVCADKGFVSNELTFSNLMVAMGREGDMDGVKSVLKSVWNINVDLLGTFDEEELESPTFYEEGHHLRPSEELLFTVAHVFGMNNDIRTGWLLVDFISRNYVLQITERVWLQLCEWAFVLSLHRSQAQRAQGQDIGQIDQQIFVQLFEAMIGEPHNVQPSSVMYYLLSRSWRDKRNLNNTIHYVEKLRNIVDLQFRQIEQLIATVMEYINSAWRSSDTQAFANARFYDLRRRYTIQFLELQRNLQFLNVAVHRSLLGETDWSGSGKLTEWERQRLPDIVGLFPQYLPNTVKYQTKTGKVELNTKQERRAQLHRRYGMDIRTLPRIFNAMDTDDQTQLNRRMMLLTQVITDTKQYCFHCESTDHDHHVCPKLTNVSNTKGPKKQSKQAS